MADDAEAEKPRGNPWLRFDTLSHCWLRRQPRLSTQSPLLGPARAPAPRRYTLREVSRMMRWGSAAVRGAAAKRWFGLLRSRAAGRGRGSQGLGLPLARERAVCWSIVFSCERPGGRGGARNRTSETRVFRSYPKPSRLETIVPGPRPRLLTPHGSATRPTLPRGGVRVPRGARGGGGALRTK